jgi:glycosyltransferase involved in cell wall biosynthesis
MKETDGLPTPARTLDVSVVLPCLNESETLAGCIMEAKEALSRAALVGEIIVADNGSTDNSVAIALAAGAKVVSASPKGYGAALSAGISSSLSNYVVMGDSDGSYDFGHIPVFVEKLRHGFDVVIGNRFLGGIEPHAMPWLHRWVGNPLLTAVGRMLFSCPIGDFHCGLRAIRKDAFLQLRQNCCGMEFASEMIVRAELAGMRLAEVPTTLRPDRRMRPPHLRSFSDGWRHLKFLVFFSPLWLFLIPGAVFFLTGALLQITLIISGGLTLGGVHFGINTALAAAASILLGYQLLGSGIVVRRLGHTLDCLPPIASSERLKRLRIEFGLLLGLLLVVIGILLFIAAFFSWGKTNFGDLPSELTIRYLIPAIILITIGAQTAWLSVMVGALETYANGRPQIAISAEAPSF